MFYVIKCTGTAEMPETIIGDKSDSNVFPVVLSENNGKI